MDKANLFIAIGGVVLGLIGSILGGISVWREFDRERVRVKLIVRTRWTKETGNCLCVSVVNLSLFTVTISRVSLALGPTNNQLTEWRSYQNKGDNEFPHVLESRTSLDVVFPPNDTIKEFNRVIGVVAETACGEKFEEKLSKSPKQ